MTDDAYTTSVRIDAAPADVFPYLTSADLIVRWMGDWADLDPTPGGKLILDINGVPIRGEYLVVEPPHRLVFSWGVAGSDTLAPGSTTVEIVLRPDGGAPSSSSPTASRPRLDKHGDGWSRFLDRLTVAGSGRDPGPDPWATA